MLVEFISSHKVCEIHLLIETNWLEKIYHYKEVLGGRLGNLLKTIGKYLDNLHLVP